MQRPATAETELAAVRPRMQSEWKPPEVLVAVELPPQPGLKSHSLAELRAASALQRVRAAALPPRKPV